jgi:hypothetical protein
MDMPRKREKKKKKTNSSKKAPGVKKKSLLEHAEKITSELAESGSVEGL